ncbi:tetratricopeptide repeat protein [Enterobacter hormaechei]|uniref:tetratricopeptide repeat protein n=1 Tax=Enterobacter hormaechei TaxID=158836 RepID=UPI0030FE486F
MSGNGVPKNSKKTFELYKKAADKNYVKAITSLASLYDEGIGTKRDDAEAIKWYKKAADLGDPMGMSNLGYMYIHGEGTPKNYSLARSYLEKAADKGNEAALANLGYLYLNGLGVKKDYQKASELYQASCDKGEKIGCDSLNDMKRLGYFRTSIKQPKNKIDSNRLIAKSIDKGVNATFTWQSDVATFKANNGKIDCNFLQDNTDNAGNQATSFVCTDNVQIILKRFNESNNAYLAVMTDNFKTEVKTFSVNVYISEVNSK